MPSRRSVVIALVTVQLLFGVNYVVTKLIVGAIPPFVWASIRACVSAFLMLTMAIASRNPHPRDGTQFFLPLIPFALLGIIINQTSFLVGLRHTTATNSAILNTLIPIFTLIIVTARGQETLTPKRALGFVCALSGVLAIRNIEDFSFSNQTVIGDLLTILNCLSYSLFLSFSKKFLETHDRIWSTFWLFLYGSVGISLLATPDWIAFQWPALTGPLLAAMAFAIVGGTFLTYFLNIWALAHASSSSVALFIYIQPIVASLLAWVWLDQAPTFRTVLSSGLIFVGMLLGLAPAQPVGSKLTPVAEPVK